MSRSFQYVLKVRSWSYLRPFRERRENDSDVLLNPLPPPTTSHECRVLWPTLLRDPGRYLWQELIEKKKKKETPLPVGPRLKTWEGKHLVIMYTPSLTLSPTPMLCTSLRRNFYQNHFCSECGVDEL